MEKNSGDLLNLVDKKADSSLVIPDRPRALIIDGTSLITAMADPNIRSALLQFSTRCKAVVANRVSPDQKRSLVQLIKNGEALRPKIDVHRAVALSKCDQLACFILLLFLFSLSCYGLVCVLYSRLLHQSSSLVSFSSSITSEHSLPSPSLFFPPFFSPPHPHPLSSSHFSYLSPTFSPPPIFSPPLLSDPRFYLLICL